MNLFPLQSKVFYVFEHIWQWQLLLKYYFMRIIFKHCWKYQTTNKKTKLLKRKVKVILLETCCFHIFFIFLSLFITVFPPQKAEVGFGNFICRKFCGQFVWHFVNIYSWQFVWSYFHDEINLVSHYVTESITL